MFRDSLLHSLDELCPLAPLEVLGTPSSSFASERHRGLLVPVPWTGRDGREAEDLSSDSSLAKHGVKFSLSNVVVGNCLKGTSLSGDIGEGCSSVGVS